MALILGDLDRFKSVNDQRGHAVGDSVLQELAGRLRRETRAFDSIYRYGGEEFVVLLPGVELGGAVELAERLREAVRGEPAQGIPLTISLGVAATSRGELPDFARLLDEADHALYEAKHAGRDRVAGAQELALASDRRASRATADRGLRTAEDRAPFAVRPPPSAVRSPPSAELLSAAEILNDHIGIGDVEASAAALADSYANRI